MMKKIIALITVIVSFVLQLSSYAAVGDTGTYLNFKYKITSDTTVSITKYTGSEENVVVPQEIDTYTVNAIDDTAFQDKKVIKTIVLPDTIEKINNYNVFWYCTALQSINLPKSLTYLAAGAFSGCSSLEEIVIPDGITKLSKTFRGCTSLKKVVIPDSVTSIDYDTFLDKVGGTNLLKNVTIYCNEGSYAETFAYNNGIKCVVQTIKPENPFGTPFYIESREVSIKNNKPQINISLKNIDYDGGICTAYAAIYKKEYSDGIKTQLYDVSRLDIDLTPGKTGEFCFNFTEDFKENLTYKIIILGDGLEPLLNATEQVLVDAEGMEDYPKMNLFESNASNSSWDKAMFSSNSGVTGWSNLVVSDNSSILPCEAYRSFPEIVDRKVTLDFDFKMNRYMEDTRFSLLDGEDIVVGFITKDKHICLEQPDGELIQLAEYKAYSYSEDDIITYVRAEVDLKNGIINSVRVNGDIAAENVPLTKASNRIDGFDVLTSVEADGVIINRQVRINSDYIVNEDFNNQLGTLPKDWQYEMNGSKTEVYEINSRVPDRFSINVDTTDGTFKAVKNFEQVKGSPVFEVMVLQPEKRDGLSFALKKDDSTLVEIVADGEDFALKLGDSLQKFYKYQANVWYGLKMEVDAVNSKINVFVNNKRILSDIYINTNGLSPNKIEIFAAQNDNNFIFDDVKLYKKRILPDDYVPEPTVPETEKPFVMGMQVCNLWTEGQYNKSWDYIKSAPNRLPVFGPYDEGNPEMNDWEIKWLLEHGIDYEIIWAYPNIKFSADKGYSPIKPNVVREGHYIYDGFMNAEYSDKMKFAISFENSAANYSSTFCDEFFEAYVPYWIEYYFKDERYLKIDGRPIVGIYAMDKFLGMFGTMGEDDEDINAGIARFRQMCVDAGVGNPYIISHGFGYTEETFKKYSVYDIDCIGLASWPKHEGLTWQKSDIKAMSKASDKYNIDFVTSFQPRQDLAAWDLRTGFHSSGEEFFNILDWAKNELPSLITPHRLSKRLMLFMTWNEYGEGHIFMPTKEDGFTYLDCIRRAFVGGTAHTDIIPNEEQIKRINRMVDNNRLVTTVRENPIPCTPENLSDLRVKKGWYFSSGDDYTNWQGDSTASVEYQNGKLVVTPKTNEPAITCSNVPNFSLYNVTYIRIRMKGNTTSCGGNVKWTTNIDDTFDEIKRTYFESPQSKASTVYDYYVPIGQSVKRTGYLTGLKITLGLVLDKTQKFQVESIELLEDKNITNRAKIVYENTIIPCEYEPLYKNGTLMVPLREVVTSIGAKAEWYAHNNSYVIYDSYYYRGATIFKIGDIKATRANYTYTMSEAPYCVSDKINDTVYVPIDLIVNSLKIKADWDNSNKTLTLYTDQKDVDMPEGSEIIKADFFNETNYSSYRCDKYTVRRMLSATIRNAGAYVLYRTYFAGIDTDDVSHICIKLWSSVDMQIRIFFTLDDETSLNEERSSELYDVHTGMNTLTIPVEDLKGWDSGKLNYLRINPDVDTGDFELDYVALIK